MAAGKYLKAVLPLFAAACVAGAGMRASAQGLGVRTDFKFRFGTDAARPGTVPVTPESVYTLASGYGFEPGVKIRGFKSEGREAVHTGYCASDQPFYFSVALPEGNYRVTLTLGDPKTGSVTTVKAELRRLMLERVASAVGAVAVRSFTVNIHTPTIPGGDEVRLKPRERTSEWRNWDEKLTLEFNGSHPAVHSLEVTRVDDAKTLFILGDSTVCDQPQEPWSSWGQMLPRFFGPGIAVANYAESGESLRSSLGEKRLDKVLSVMKPGDYLFIQYGHNDMKEKGEGVGAYTTYKASLKHFVTEARKHGGIPVLITPMHRRSLDERGKVFNTLGDYPEAVRQAAKEENVPLIDLNAMSGILYEALGRENIGKAFQDATHHNNFGSYELARCVVEGIRHAHLPLAKFVTKDLPPFDPANPDHPDQFIMAASPGVTAAKPDSN